MKRHVLLGGGRGPVPGDFTPLVTVNVRDGRGDYVPVRFCIDTGAVVTSLTIALAESKGIAFARDERSRGTASGLVGTVAKYPGFLDVRLFGEQFRWPCAFLDAAGPASREPYGVIGRIGFLASFNACIERPWCRVERRCDHLPFWRRLLARLTPSRLHPYNVPL
jgi:hypothetical protein